MNLFDISVLPLYLHAGRERFDLPGLLVASAPRKAARLRAQDVLLLFLSLSNNGSVQAPVYSPAQQQEMLSRLAETFFTTSGSVTAGLRAVVNRLNDFLLNRNLRAASEGQVTGALNLAVLHGSTLLLAHAGPTQSMLLGKAQFQTFDDRSVGRGLGLGKQLVPRFYQAALEPGDVLVVCAKPPDLWTVKALDGASKLGLDHLRRRLLGQAGVEIMATALKFQPGKGQVVRYRAGGEPAQEPKPVTGPGPVAAAHQVEVPPAAQPPSPVNEPQNVIPGPEDVPAPLATGEADETRPIEQSLDVALPDRSPELDVTAGVDRLQEREPAAYVPFESKPPEAPPTPKDQAVDPTIQPAHTVERSTQQVPTSPPAPNRAVGRERPQPRPHKPQMRRASDGSASSNQIGRKLASGLKSILQAGTALKNRIAGIFEPLARRVFPQRSEPLINLSPGSMLFIAICIPLVVVAIATTVYFNAGRMEQFDTYVATAGQYIDRASVQTDLEQQRESWVQALLWLDKADQYNHSDVSIALREKAQNGLDSLDGIVRLEFQPAVEQGFAVDVNITRIVASLNDVYLLDSSQGRVLRIYRVGSGYEVDSNFICRPGQAGGVIIGPLVDLAVLPPNNKYRATVMAADSSGNLVYCAPNQTGYDSMVMPAPDTNWGDIRAINVSDGFIYILDPAVNAVWYIFGNNESSFDQSPHLFFSNQVPQMDDVTAMAIDSGFLYLLHSDGRMTTCEASGFELSPTRCTDPTPYGDSRVGRDSAPLNFPDAHFVQILTTQPPDPSLFILDDSQASVYHFSLRRLNLQRQYRPLYDPDFPLPETPASAFVVTPNRRIFLAFGNQIFFANLP